MKLIHTSDLHLGITVMGENLIEMQSQMVDRLCEIADQYDAGGVIIAGDVFDRAVSSKDAVELYNRMATELCIRRRRKLFIAAGNHDGAERLASCNKLLEQAGLYVRGRLALPIEPIEAGEADLYILPYFNADEARILLEDSEIKDAESAMRAILNTIKLRKGRRSILVGHCFVKGCATSESDRSAVVGGASAISGDLFGKFDYVALGHLHKPQRIGGNIRYSGTPMQYSFSEEDQEKHVVVIDTETMEQETVPVNVGRDFHTIQGTYEEIMKQEADMSRFVRIILTDREVPVGLREELKGKYRYLMQLVSRYKPKGMEEELSVGEIQQLHPTEILNGFLTEFAGRTSSNEERDWFESAYQQALRGIEP